jgi:hypothetical protein
MKALCIPLLLLAACSTVGPQGTTGSSAQRRISTLPPGARLFVPRLNLTYTTPCDVTDEVGPGDEIVITMNGYRTWRGPLRDLTQVAVRSYELHMER